MNTINMDILWHNPQTSFTVAYNYGAISDIIDRLVNGDITNYSKADFLQNDSDYIASIIYYPILIGPFFDTSSTTRNIYIGKVTAQLSEGATAGILYDNGKMVKVINLTTLEKRHNNFLDYEPYTKVTLYFPFFEAIEIPCRNAFDTGFQAWLSVDFTNGHATLYITDNNADWIIATRETVLGIQIPIGAGNEQEQQRNKLLQYLSLGGAVVAGGIGAMTGNPIAIGGAIGLATSFVKQQLQNSVDTYSGRGGSGNRDSVVRPLQIRVAVETVKNVKRPSEKGRPLNLNTFLSSLSGYTQVGEIHFDTKNYHIYNDEINEIVSLLQNGVIL